MPLPISPYLLHHYSQLTSTIGQVNAIIKDPVEGFHYLSVSSKPAGRCSVDAMKDYFGMMGNGCGGVIWPSGWFKKWFQCGIPKTVVLDQCNFQIYYV